MNPTDAQKHQFYSEMAKLLGAGFGIRDAAGVMLEHGLPAAMTELLRELNQGLDRGKSITESLAANPETVSRLEKNIIGAGERSGRMGPAMRHLADYFGMFAEARREALKGLIHPAIVLHLGVFIGTVPTAMLDSGKSAAAIAGGFFVTLLTAYVAAFLLFIAIRAVLRAARGNAAIDRVIHGIPVLGKARNNLAMAGFCKVYHTCLLAGISMCDTVAMASEASHSGMVVDAGKRLAKTLAGGNPLGPAIIAEPVFPRAFARSYATGEAAGTLDKDMENWGNLFQKDAESSVRTLALVIPKLLYFLIMIYVAWRIAGFYSSYYGSLLKELE
jgi:type II secretory pathway component PulF